MPTRAIEAIRAGRLDDRRPFAALPSTAPDVWLKVNLLRITRRLSAAGKIEAAYSCHDLRHYFAERNKGKGVLWLQTRLGHSSLTITERYLRNTFSGGKL